MFFVVVIHNFIEKYVEFIRSSINPISFYWTRNLAKYTLLLKNFFVVYFVLQARRIYSSTAHFISLMLSIRLILSALITCLVRDTKYHVWKNADKDRMYEQFYMRVRIICFSLFYFFTNAHHRQRKRLKKG